MMFVYYVDITSVLKNVVVFWIAFSCTKKNQRSNHSHSNAGGLQEPKRAFKAIIEKTEEDLHIYTIRVKVSLLWVPKVSHASFY